MKNYNTIDPIDEALRLVFLNANSIDASNDLNRITEMDYSVNISSDKAKKMVDDLYEKLAVDSLGVLITKAIGIEKAEVERIAAESNLPVVTIEQLQGDIILANSIPVIPFKNLLKKLNIPFDKAKEAIIKSFHILKNDMALPSYSISSIKLARRRNARAAIFSSKIGKSENQYLFQNEEALNKYLNRLSELF